MEYDILYGLIIDDKLVNVSPSFISLLIEIITNKIINYQIINIKE
jgi:hypothetical protein